MWSSATAHILCFSFSIQLFAENTESSEWSCSIFVFLERIHQDTSVTRPRKNFLSGSQDVSNEEVRSRQGTQEWRPASRLRFECISFHFFSHQPWCYRFRPFLSVLQWRYAHLCKDHSMTWTFVQWLHMVLPSCVNSCANEHSVTANSSQYNIPLHFFFLATHLVLM